MASYASVSSSRAAISASGTKRPPKMPKCPVSSGQLGRAGARRLSGGCSELVVMPLVSPARGRDGCRGLAGGARRGGVGPGGDQVGDRLAGVPGGDQALPDQDGVGPGAGVRDQVVG